MIMHWNRGEKDPISITTLQLLTKDRGQSIPYRQAT